MLSQSRDYVNVALSECEPIPGVPFAHLTGVVCFNIVCGESHLVAQPLTRLVWLDVAHAYSRAWLAQPLGLDKLPAYFASE